MIADKVLDSDPVIAEMNARGAKIILSQHLRRSKPLVIETEVYKWRHLIENFFGKIKEFRHIAFRADKSDQSFKAMIYLTAPVTNSSGSRQSLVEVVFHAGLKLFIYELHHGPHGCEGQL